MMRVCKRLSDGRIIESQSGDGALDVLIQNAVSAGFQANEVEALEMSDQDFTAALEAQNAIDAPPNVPPISDRQFAHALKLTGVITHAEAMAFVQTGTIPALLMAAINAIEDQETREAAELLVAGATEFYLMHPMSIALGVALGWTDEQRAALWATAAAL